MDVNKLNNIIWHLISINLHFLDKLFINKIVWKYVKVNYVVHIFHSIHKKEHKSINLHRYVIGKSFN